MKRKELNKQQTELRRVMLESDQYEKVIELFLHQHALLHSSNMANDGLWS